MKRESLRCFLPIALASIAPLHSYSAVTVTIQEFNSDVIVSASGSINLTALTFDGASSYNPLIAPSISFLTVGTAGTGDVYAGATGPSSFGPGSSFTAANISSDNLFGIVGGLGQIVVPQNYVSNDPISSTSFYLGHSFASLGINEGTYVWSWGSGGDADSATINVVPESSTYALFLSGLVFAGIAISRRRRKS